jgi:heptosyltransferase III
MTRASLLQGPPARRLLLIQRDNIGDLVLSTPFIRLLRARFPNAQIDALVTSYNAPVLGRNPHIDAVVTYVKWKHRRDRQSLLQYGRETARIYRELRRVRYDVAFLLNRGYQWSALRLALASGARNVAGFTDGHGLLQRGVNLPVPIASVTHLHMVQRAAALLPVSHPGARDTAIASLEMPPCEVFPDPTLREKLTSKLMASGILPCSLLIAVHISARLVDQRWPADCFVELIQALHAKLRAAVLLFWSPGAETDKFHPGDDAKGKYILDRCAGLPVYGVQTTLSELIAGISLAQLMICSDGGAMHVAAALGLPIVGMFGETVVALWHPWKTRYVALRPPSLKVTDVPVADAFNAACLLLNHESAGV